MNMTVKKILGAIRDTMIAVGVILFIGLAIYTTPTLHKDREISELNYDRLIEYSQKYPTLNARMTEALADGVITNGEFSGILGEYQDITIKERKERLSNSVLKKIGDNNAL